MSLIPHHSDTYISFRFVDDLINEAIAVGAAAVDFPEPAVMEVNETAVSLMCSDEDEEAEEVRSSKHSHESQGLDSVFVRKHRRSPIAEIPDETS